MVQKGAPMNCLAFCFLTFCSDEVG